MVNCAVERLIGISAMSCDMVTPEALKRLKEIAWSAHQIKSQQALDVGTKVHHWIKSGAMVEAEACEESKACWKAYSQFAMNYALVPIAQEVALYDLERLFAGTCDWIGILGATKAHSAQNTPILKSRRTIYIIDWKTSKAINDNYKMQVTVYKHMILALLKEFKKYPSRFSESNTRILNAIILAAGSKLKIVCGIVRLPKKSSTRKAFEFVTITAKEEKAYLKEFVLMAKLHNLRTAKESVNGNTDGR